MGKHYMITCSPHPGELPLVTHLYTPNISDHMLISDVTFRTKNNGGFFSYLTNTCLSIKTWEEGKNKVQLCPLM